MAELPVSGPSIPSVVQRYLNGESLQQLASEYDKCHRTIYNWLLKECGPQYEEMVTQALVARIADADWQLETATTPLQIARARECAKFSRMDFERRRPKLYGQKQEIQQDTTIRVLIEPIPAPKVRQVQQIEASPDSAEMVRDTQALDIVSNPITS